MKDYTKMLPVHTEKYIGENDLFLEICEGEGHCKEAGKRPPLLFIHGAYTGSWMWSKYIPHFIKGNKGISIDSRLITCPALVIKSVNNPEDDRRGRVEAEHLKGEYSGFWSTTHTGLLVGQRYMEIVDRIMEWLKKFLE